MARLRLGMRVVVAIVSLQLIAAPQTAPIFVFEPHEFWLNLHHFLYVLGRARNKTPDSNREVVASAPADQDRGLATLSAAERRIWEDAAATYAAGLSQKDAVFDDPLPSLASALAAAKDAPKLADPSIDSAAAAVLERTAPVYRKAWWPAHRAANDAWVANVQEFVNRHGQAVRRFITNAYKMDWPAAGYPVHISAYSNWAGAYSTRGNLLVVSSHKSLSGALGLELVFHEGMHQWDDEMAAALRRQAQPLGARVPPSLSHAIVFFTAGEAVRRVIPGHVTLADASGVWERGIKPFKIPLEEVWKPYLDGRGTRDEALAELIRRTAR